MRKAVKKKIWDRSAQKYLDINKGDIIWVYTGNDLFTKCPASVSSWKEFGAAVFKQVSEKNGDDSIHVVIPNSENIPMLVLKRIKIDAGTLPSYSYGYIVLINDATYFLYQSVILSKLCFEEEA